MAGIIVRVINKKLEQGKLYNKKLVVNEVHDRYHFSCQPLESGEGLLKSYSQLTEKDIETVIPRSGEANASVLIL